MTTAIPMKRFEPAPGEGAEQFWEATREQRLVLPWCVDCEAPFFHPRPTCPLCLGEQIEWRTSAGTGDVYAVTVEHRPQNPLMKEMVPYAVALVDLDDGVRLMTNVVGCPPGEVVVGMRVRVTWEALTDGRHLPQFEPVERNLA